MKIEISPSFKIHIFIVMISLSISSCAVQPKLVSRADWISATTRDYENVTKDEVLESADYLLRLVDGNDFSIAHQTDSLQARRQWVSYVLIFGGFGTDYWDIRASEVNGKIKTSVIVSTQSQTAGATEISISGGTPSLSPSFGDAIKNPAVYKLFWARMDYLLGKSDVWLTCSDASKKFNVNTFSDGMEVLCNPLNIADNFPTRVIKKD